MSSHDPFSNHEQETEDNGFPDAPLPPADLPQEDIVDVLSASPPPRPPHPGFWWSGLWCIGFFFLLNGTLLAVFIIVFLGQMALEKDRLQQFGHMTPEEITKSDELAYAMAPAILIGEAVSLIGAWLIVRLVVGRDWTRRLALRRPSFFHFTLVLVGMPAMLLLPGVVHELAKQVGLPSWGDDSELQAIVNHWPWWFGVLVIGLCPGIGEELFCRGFLGRGLVGRYGYLVGVLLTSAFFGVLHVSPAKVVATAVMGIWLHFIYLMSRSLLLPMMAHFLNNSLAVLSSQIPDLEKVDPDTHKLPWYVLAATTFLMLAVVFALYRSRARLVATGEPVEHPWQPDFPGVEYPPPGSGMVVSRPWPGWLASGMMAAAVVAFGAAFYYQWLLELAPGP